MPKPANLGWADLPQRGPRVKALCLGINKYDHLEDLANCEQDAKVIADKVKNLAGEWCTADVCTGTALKDKAAMRKKVLDFVATIDKEAPPRVVIVSYSGHAIQDGASILMVPSGASAEPDALKQEGFAHDELFKIFYEELHQRSTVRVHRLALLFGDVSCDAVSRECEIQSASELQNSGTLCCGDRRRTSTTSSSWTRAAKHLMDKYLLRDFPKRWTQSAATQPLAISWVLLRCCGPCVPARTAARSRLMALRIWAPSLRTLSVMTVGCSSQMCP